MIDYGLKSFFSKNLVMWFSLSGSVNYDPHVWVCVIFVKLTNILCLWEFHFIHTFLLSFVFASTSLFKLLSFCLTLPLHIACSLSVFIQSPSMQLSLFLNLRCRRASSSKSSYLHLKAGVRECAAMPVGELAFLGTLTPVLFGISWLLDELFTFLDTVT